MLSGARHPTGGSPAQIVRVRMPAKVNLHLGVYPGRDAHGYHHVDSVMIAVGLYDEVIARPSANSGVTYHPPVDCEVKNSAAWRAMVALDNEQGMTTHTNLIVTRHIPSESGLGSASADAAATLHACRTLWGAATTDDDFTATAQSVGADVAFFLNPAPSLFVGAGNKLAETYTPLDAAVVLLRPNAGVSTAAAYTEFDHCPTEPRRPTAMCAALKAGDVGAVAANLYNNLADAAIRLAPEVGEVLTWVRSRVGVLGAQVTGSGSCVFALCETDATAADVAMAAADAGWWTHATRTVGPHACSMFVV